MGAKKIYGHDFKVLKTEIINHINLNYLDLNKGFKNADIVFIMNNHEKYKI